MTHTSISALTDPSSRARSKTMEALNSQSLELDDKELETVERFNERFAHRRRPVTLDTLLNGWMSLVAEVEAGYAGLVDDYNNDLTSRDLLEDLIRDYQPSLRAKLEGALEPWDERFRRATTHDDGQALSRFFRFKDGWWRRRTPAKGQLATYLRSRGDHARDD